MRYCFAADGGPHLWTLASEHCTSQGTVRYVRCDCGQHDVQLCAELIASCG